MESFAVRGITESEGWEPLGPEIPLEALEGHPRVLTLTLAHNRGGIDASGFAVGDPSRFRISLRRTEVLLVLEGRITVEMEDGGVVDLAPGQCIQLDGGQTVTWTYHERVKVFYVMQTPA